MKDKSITISGKEVDTPSAIWRSDPWNAIDIQQSFQIPTNRWFDRYATSIKTTTDAVSEITQYLNELLHKVENQSPQKPYADIDKWTSQWTSKRIKIHAHFVTFIVEEINKSLPTTAYRKPFPYDFYSVAKLFTELEKDFDDLSRRIARCGLLEEELRSLEETLQNEEPEYLSWCVSLLRDVFDYNYAENLNRSHLQIIRSGINLICQRGSSCNREEYKELHRNLIQTGLSLLPNSDKACEKYGYEEKDNGRQSLLFS